MEKIKMKSNFNLGNFIIAVMLPLTVGIIAGKLNSQSIEVYKSFEKPGFFPPPLVFIIVWTSLYVLMGIASYMAWSKSSSKEKGKRALSFYLVQLALNFIWSFIFFTYRLYGLAFIELIILMIFVVITAMSFFKVHKLSGILMLPYIIWILFAGYLNFYIWMNYEMVM